jgi:predicted lactoylglutathione lyase
MTKQIFVNLPVKDLNKSTEFYKALGFTQNMDFSNEKASAMVWSEDIYVMLLTHDFYKTFLKGKEIADVQTTSGALFALSLESKEAVQQFADIAKQNGGDYYKSETGVPEEMMFGYEVQDIDGHTWEPLWMNPEFNPRSTT